MKEERITVEDTILTNVTSMGQTEVAPHTVGCKEPSIASAIFPPKRPYSRLTLTQGKHQVKPKLRDILHKSGLSSSKVSRT